MQDNTSTENLTPDDEKTGPDTGDLNQQKDPFSDEVDGPDPRGWPGPDTLPNIGQGFKNFFSGLFGSGSKQQENGTSSTYQRPGPQPEREKSAIEKMRDKIADFDED